MIRKLLLFVRSLFLLFFDSSKERSFSPSLRLICFGMFFVVSNNYGQCSTYPAGAAISGSAYTFCIDGTASYTTGTVNNGRYALVNVIKGYVYTFSVGNIYTATGVVENLNLFDASNDSFIIGNSTPTGAAINNWLSTISGQVKVLLSKGSCVNDGSTGGALTLTQVSSNNTVDNQAFAGTNVWRGHIYNWTGTATPPGGAPSPATPPNTDPFDPTQYAGYYDVGSETIGIDFGGNCFNVFSNNSSTARATIYPELFAVRYRMNSKRAAGCYLVTIRGDDGVRLYVDNQLVFDEWKQQSAMTYGNVLVYLNGNSDLILDYYENTGNNEVSFSITPFLTSTNTVTAPTTTTVCSGVAPAVIDGSSYLYNGSSINPSIKYQWQSAPDVAGAAGTWSNVTTGTGITLEDYTPAAITGNTTTNITWYRRTVIAAATNAATACTYYSNAISITTRSTTTAVLPANQTICSGTQPADLMVTTGTGNTFQWQVATSLTGTYNNITGATSNPLTSAQMGALTATRFYRVIITSPFSCLPTTTTTGITVTVNPSHTITAGANRSVCQNVAITNIIMTIGGGATSAFVTNLPPGVVATLSGTGNTTLTITGTPTVSGVFNYTALTSGNTCPAATATGTITVGVSNNIITYTSGNSGSVCVQAAENADGTFTAPAGTYFNTVSFASYGTPTGSCGSFAINNACHNANSQSIVESRLLGNSNTILIPATNAVFPDPCSGIGKNLYVTTYYSEPICAGSLPGTITGSLAVGNGTNTYLWERSTTSSTTGFSNAAGTNNTQSYTPPALAQTTWFRRTVTSNTCTNISAVVLIKVNPAPALTNASQASAVCVGSAATINLTGLLASSTSTVSYTIGGAAQTASVTATAGGIGSFTTPVLTAANIGQSLQITGITTTSTTPNCSQSFTTNFILSINPVPTLTNASQAAAVCVGSAATINLTGLLASSISTVSYSIGGTAQTAITGLTATAGGTASFTTPALTAANIGQSLQITGITTTSATPNCSQTFTQNFTLSINPTPALTNASQAAAVCVGSAATINLTGLIASSTSTVSYTIGGGAVQTASVTATAGGTGSFTTPVLTAANIGQSLQITGITTTSTTPNCSKTFTTNFILSINPVPALTNASQAAAVCVGSAATINLTGLLASSTSTISYTIGGAAQTASGVTATAGGVASFTTPVLTAANIGQSLQITGITTTSATPNCSQSFTTNFILSINPLPNITTQPQAIAVCQGKNHSFTVATNAVSPTYQWQYSLNQTLWTNTNSVGGVSGHNSASLDITSVPQSYSGYYVRCIITSNTCSSTSNSVQLTVNPSPAAPVASVTIEPTCVVNTGTITVTPVTGVTYSVDGSTYTNTDGVFPGLAVGSYNVTTQNSSGCISPITVVQINAYTAKRWTGAVSTDWNTAGNWDSNSVPGASDCIVIPDLTSIVNKPEITGTNSSFAGNSLTLNTNSSLKVGSTNTLKITNSVNVDPTSSLIFENNSSLIQVANVTNTGNITYKRTTAPVRRYDFTYWSSPITKPLGFTLHDLSPDTLGDKYYSYIPGIGWLIDYNGILVMNPAQGYIVRAPQWFDITSTALYTAIFTGVPNNGNITVKPAAAKWNLIGNPYPSAIDGRKLISDNANVGSIYLWTHNSPPNGALLGDKRYNYTTNDYAVMNGTGGVKTGGNASLPTGYIAAGQAFFINAANDNDIVFTNSMRFGNNSDFYKTAATGTDNRLWLNMTNTEGAFKQLLVGYIPGATNSWDLNYDAATMNGNTFVDFYSINEGDKLTIQGRALPFENTDTVPLGYKTSVAGDFTISIDQGDGLFTSQDVYLEDKLTSTIQDLKAGNYTFTTAVGTFIDRFTLRYTDKTLGTGDFENITDGLLVSVKDKIIKVTSAKEQIKEISVFDISGKLLYNKKKVNAAEFSITNLQAADQVLLVKVTLENNFTAARKIIFK